MFSQQRLTRIVLAITAVLSWSACMGGAQHLASLPTPTKSPTVTSSANDLINAPVPTVFVIPEKDILPPPTLTMSETFECWITPGSGISTRQDGLGQLLIAYSVDRSSTLNLYRFDLASQKYSLLVSQIESYAPSPNGLNVWYSFLAGLQRTIQTPMQDVIFAHNLADDTRRQVPFPVLIDTIYGHVVWSPDSQCLFAWRDDTAFAYRLKDGALQSKTFPGANFGYNASAVSLDGCWWAWDCEKGFHPLNPNEQHFCLMSPQGQRIDHDGLRLPVTSEQGSGFSTRSLGWWSPDSRVLAIAYPGYRFNYQDAIRLIHVDETGVSSFQDIELKERRIIQRLLWSPDSHQLLILDSADKLYIYHPETKEMTTVPTPDGNYLKAAAWSPYGKQIAIVTEDKQYKFSLYVMNADDTHASPIPPLPQEAKGAEMVAPSYRIDQVYWVP